MTPAHILTELELQEQICQYAELKGWGWMHIRAGRTGYGWRVPISGPLGAGWPDLVLVRERDRRFILAELKTDAGKVSPLQRAILQMLAHVVPEVYLFRPRDWPQIEQVLA